MRIRMDKDSLATQQTMRWNKEKNMQLNGVSNLLEDPVLSLVDTNSLSG